jgi:peroxiredoxin
MTGDRAPEFDLPALTGGRRRLRDLLASGPVLVVFYKVACPTCQLTLPFLERLHQRAPSGSLQIIAISQDDAEASFEFNRRFGISFPTLLDPREEAGVRYPASNAYAITNVPTLFLVEQDGRITEHLGAFEKAALERIARRFGVELFTACDRVPVFRPG